MTGHRAPAAPLAANAPLAHAAITAITAIVAIAEIAVLAGVVFSLASIVGPPALHGLEPASGGDARSRRAERVLVEKQARRLTLLRGGKVLRTYRIALGGQPVGDKVCRGDHKTPEGLFTVDRHVPNSHFHRALHVSYPDAAHRRTALRRGCDPGGDIMIHGITNGLGWLGPLHRRTDWTDGCMAVTDEEIEEIYAAVPNGTPVDIRP
jgi:L,D-transpeptidase-like protein